MKIALITGGSKGIGKGTAVELARRGQRVVITYNSSPTDAQNVVTEIEEKGGSAFALKLDVSQLTSFPDFISELQKRLKSEWSVEKIDHLFNNAGVGGYSLIENVSEQEFDLMMNVHLKGPFFLTKALLPLIQDGGHIVNMSSATTRVAFPGCAPYASMKGAVNVLTRYLAKELGSRGIRANSVSPGAILTGLAGGIGDSTELIKMVSDMTALGKVGEPIDVARVVASLFSEDGGWINGQCIEISGGMNL
ncbi:MAG: SDR family oxidoreductase [Proteobacteria bacterium]|nr:MAG: SDR family oxidoreductase [Pseudomonadota bacterium]